MEEAWWLGNGILPLVAGFWRERLGRGPILKSFAPLPSRGGRDRRHRVGGVRNQGLSLLFLREIEERENRCNFATCSLLQRQLRRFPREEEHPKEEEEGLPLQSDGGFGLGGLWKRPQEGQIQRQEGVDLGLRKKNWGGGKGGGLKEQVDSLFSWGFKRERQKERVQHLCSNSVRG